MELATDYHPPGMNQYCHAKQYSADNELGAEVQARFGAPAVASGTTVDTGGLALDGAPGLERYASQMAGVTEIDARYGRNVTVTPSGAPTTTDAIVDVHCEDYIGQPFVERFTLPAAATAAVEGAKAAKRVVKAVLVQAGSAAETLAIGVGSELGLPMTTMEVLREIEDNVVGTLGTLTVPDKTDPQTNATGDPRGTYAPNGTLDGSAEFVAHLVVDQSVNADGRGGLHGIKHYAGA